MYIANGAENCKWCQFITVPTVKDCVDYSGWGNNVEMAYESANVGDNVSNSKFSCYSFPDILNSEYIFWCIAAKNNFGCVNLKRKSYCILNKQYTKEEYTKIKAQIIEDMQKNPYSDELGRAWTYGDFFLPGFSKYPYNNSNAYKFFPKTKEEAIKLGYFWNDEVKQDFQETISGDKLPETMSQTNDSILNEVISCITCARKYKIITLEFDLLRKMGLPIPHECPRCRENTKFNRLTRPKLYNRNCAKCSVDIYTPYAPERPEIVYCVKCYQQEFA